MFELIMCILAEALTRCLHSILGTQLHGYFLALQVHYTQMQNVATKRSEANSGCLNINNFSLPFLSQILQAVLRMQKK